jgi:hypothetical protein
MKYLALLTLTLSTAAFSASTIECNSYPLPVGLKLQRTPDLRSFEGHAQDGYFNAQISQCQVQENYRTPTNVTCKINWNFRDRQGTFQLIRKPDGTYQGVISRGINNKLTALSCILKG